ncbi:Wzz/FepE/Etk N-terminal domain-containing protein [Legionella jamestowniensis]|uniref:LPS O-antigen length regulator n=1 Tax=Legionella jamestowniensis TaxID=455 RepID=A0A0W0UFW0_9GAMM|nr:Wzz/FepE/Etk N-terminal domain-containing protein [Legionella jamestowniensis]KTD06811.1 LPS O-antigen length regulator [Legionella jamestowniensis]SFL82889.1 chain length determinant protein (polysaccharide antigen chain regulator) [Legionella jamestowniensis DSM 19215]
MKQSISNSYNSEVDLIELCKLLWKRKLFIIGITILFCLAAIIITGLIKPVFTAKVTFVSPINSDIAPLNFGRSFSSPLKPINTIDSYNIFRGVLLSDSVKNEFLDNLQGIKAAKKQNEPISLTTLQEAAQRYSVIITAHSQRAAKQNALSFIDLVNKKSREKMYHAMEMEKNAYKEHYKHELALLHKAADEMRENQLETLKKAYQTASSLGITDPSISKGPIISDSSIHLRGTKALTTEIKNLKHRSYNDISPEVRKLKLEYDNIISFKPNMKQVLLARVDDDIVVSEAINNKRKFIIIFAMFIGFVLSCSWVILRNIKSILAQE